MMAAEVHVEPADDDRHGGVRAHGDEEQCRVFQLLVVVDGDEDGKAGNGDGDRDDGEDEAVLG